MKTCAMFIAYDPEYEPLSHSAINSFKYFHPDIDVHYFTKKDDNLIPDRIVFPHFIPIVSVRLFHMKRLLTELGYDKLISMGVDTVTCGRAREFLEGSHDAYASYNVPFDFVWNGERKCGIYDYSNVDVMAISGQLFINDWIEACKDEESYWRSKCYHAEQAYWNLLIHSGKYDVKWVEQEGAIYNERGRDLWHLFDVREGEAWVGDNRLVVMHWAGGCSVNHKWSYGLWNDDQRKWLDKICQSEDFEKIKGLPRWW